MKKIFFAAALAITAIAGLHAQSADDKDIAKLEAKLAESKDGSIWTRANLNIKIELARHGTPESFEKLKELVAAGADKVEFNSATQKQHTIDAHIATFSRWWYKMAFIREGYTYARATGKGWWQYVIHYSPKLEIPNAERYALTKEALLSCKLNSKQVLKGITQLTKLAPFIDETEVKADLKKLNRFYSPNLIKDKAAWEPVVAMIRTALETY